MLIYSLIIAFILLLGIISGKKVVSILGLTPPSTVGAAWVGILTIGCISVGISLFVGLSWIIGFLPIALIAWLIRHDIKQKWTILFSSESLSILILAVISGWYINQHMFWLDSGQYEIQAIKWLSEYGYVYGLGLINAKLGVISSWYTIPAYFNHSILEGSVYAVMGGVALALALMHLAKSITDIYETRGSLASRFAVFAYMLAFIEVFKWGIPISPSPDFAVIVLSIFIGSVFVEILETDEAEQKKSLSILSLLLSTLALAIKLSAFPLLVISALFAFFCHRGELKTRKLVLVAAFCAALLLPNALASWKTTGNLWYPLPLSTETSWSLSAQNAHDEASMLSETAKWEGARPDGAPEYGYIFPKYKADTIASGRIYQFLIAAWSIGVVLVLLAANSYRKNHRYTPFLLAAFGAVVFFYLTTPSLRYGLGILVWLPALSVALWRQKKAEQQTSQPQKWASILSSSLILLIAVRLIGHQPIEQGVQRQIAQKVEIQPSWLIPLQIQNVQPGFKVVGQKQILIPMKIETEKLEDNGFAYFVPKEDGFCWSHQLPCVYSKLDEVILKDTSKGTSGGYIKASAK